MTVHARSRRWAGFLAGAGLVASSLTAVGVASPAQAAAPEVACTWIEAGGLDNRENTTRCTKPGQASEAVTHRDCWKYRPPTDSLVRVKRGTAWVDTEIPVGIRRAASCPKSHPWLTRVTLPATKMKPFWTRSYRLFMPAHEVEVAGKTIEVDEATLNMFVCRIREGSTRPCS